MQFKETINKNTLNHRYYIDSMRTTQANFNFRETLCRIEGLNYNSSITIADEKYIRHCFNYN